MSPLVLKKKRPTGNKYPGLTKEERGTVVSLATHIYIMKCGEFYKIGHALDASKRRIMLQIGNPIEIEIIFSHVLNDAKTVEKMLHGRFAHKHVRGEWFSLTEQDVNLIRDFVTNNI